MEDLAIVQMRSKAIGNKIILPNEVNVESNQSKTVCKHSDNFVN